MIEIAVAAFAAIALRLAYVAVKSVKGGTKIFGHQTTRSVEDEVSGLESDYTGDGPHFVSNDVAFTVGCSPGSTASLRVRRPPPFEPNLRRIPRKDRAEIIKLNLEERAHQRESAERQCEMFLLTVPAVLSAFKWWGNGERQRMLPPQQAHIGYQAPPPMITDSGSDRSLFKISVEPSLKYDIGGDDD